METICELKEAVALEVFFIYLCEAHALDVWPLSPLAPKSHADLAERQTVAEDLLSSFPAFASLLSGTFLDNMDNEVTETFGLWPERYLLLQGGTEPSSRASS